MPLKAAEQTRESMARIFPDAEPQRNPIFAGGKSGGQPGGDSFQM